MWFFRRKKPTKNDKMIYDRGSYFIFLVVCNFHEYTYTQNRYIDYFYMCVCVCTFTPYTHTLTTENKIAALSSTRPRDLAEARA